MSTPREIRAARKFSAAQAAWDARAEDQGQFDDATALLKIGDAEVLVAYVAPFGVVSITGAYIGAEFVDADEFSRRRLDAWQGELQRRLASDAADAAELAHESAAMWGDAA